MVKIKIKGLKENESLLADGLKSEKQPRILSLISVPLTHVVRLQRPCKPKSNSPIFIHKNKFKKTSNFIQRLLTINRTKSNIETITLKKMILVDNFLNK